MTRAYQCPDCGDVSEDGACSCPPTYDRAAHIADVLPLYRDRAREFMFRSVHDCACDECREKDAERLAMLLATVAVESMP